MYKNTENSDRIVQWLTLFSVVIGVGLVVYELRQTREMTLTQLIHGTITQIQDERIARYGENLGEVLATACLEPDKLTPAQAFVLDAYFNAQVAIVNRYRVQVEIGGFVTEWKRLGRPVVMRVLAFPQGKAWLEQHPLWMSPAAPPELREYFEGMAQEKGIHHCNELLIRILPATLERLAQDGADA